jgi:hypothetical protein
MFLWEGHHRKYAGGLQRCRIVDTPLTVPQPPLGMGLGHLDEEDPRARELHDAVALVSEDRGRIPLRHFSRPFRRGNRSSPGACSADTCP